MVVCQRRRKVRERAWSRGDCYLGLRRQLGGTAASLVAGIQNRDVARRGPEHQTTVRKIGAVRRPDDAYSAVHMASDWGGIDCAARQRRSWCWLGAAAEEP